LFIQAAGPWQGAVAGRAPVLRTPHSENCGSAIAMITTPGKSGAVFRLLREKGRLETIGGGDSVAGTAPVLSATLGVYHAPWPLPFARSRLEENFLWTTTCPHLSHHTSSILCRTPRFRGTISGTPFEHETKHTATKRHWRYLRSRVTAPPASRAPCCGSDNSTR
jgi:hypothetical protein